MRVAGDAVGAVVAGALARRVEQGEPVEARIEGVTALVALHLGDAAREGEQVVGHRAGDVVEALAGAPFAGLGRDAQFPGQPERSR